MPRTAQPRTPTAGEVVSYFTESPIASAVSVLDIVKVLVAKRLVPHVNPLRIKIPKSEGGSIDSIVRKKRGRPKKTEEPASA